MLRFRGRGPCFSGFHFAFSGGQPMIGNRHFSMTIRRDHYERFTAVLAGQPKFRHGEDMRWTARKALKQLVQREDLHIKNVVGKPFVGNRLGLDLAHIATRLATLEWKFSLEERKTADLKEEVLDQQRPSEGYKIIRNRFMTKFNRVYLKKYDDLDSKIVSAGNLAAHQCDINVDAMLYMSAGPGRHQRTDPDAFQALYGVQPHIVSKLKYRATLDALNFHADAILANPKHLLTEKTHESIQKIIELLDKFGTDQGNDDLWEDAYESFWKCHKADELEED